MTLRRLITHRSCSATQSMPSRGEAMEPSGCIGLPTLTPSVPSEEWGGCIVLSDLHYGADTHTHGW